MPTLLLTKSDYTDYIDLPLNFDMKKLNTYLLSFQNSYLSDVLTSALFDDFVLKYAGSIATTPVALTTDYAALREKIIPYLAFGSYGEYLPFSRQKPTNSGTVAKLVDKADIISSEEVGVKLLYTQRKTTEYRTKLVDFLVANKANYPLYVEPEKCEEEQSQSRVMALGKPDPNIDSYYFWQD